MRRVFAAVAVTALAAAGLAACGSAENAEHPSAHTSPTATATHTAHPTEAVASTPLRAGERRVEVRMPTAYKPSAPTGVGTDDYRCFLLDPKVTQDSFVTGFNVKPGNPNVVHHVILFRVPPDRIAEAKAKDAETKGQGWPVSARSSTRARGS